MKDSNTSHIITNSTLHQDTLRAKLEAARKQLGIAQRGITSNEGRLLDHDTAADIWRTLDAASRNLADVSIKLAVYERKAAQHV